MSTCNLWEKLEFFIEKNALILSPHLNLRIGQTFWNGGSIWQLNLFFFLALRQCRMTHAIYWLECWNIPRTYVLCVIVKNHYIKKKKIVLTQICRLELFLFNSNLIEWKFYRDTMNETDSRSHSWLSKWTSSLIASVEIN